MFLVNCGDDSHPITAANQFALIREAPPGGASISAAQRHLPMTLRRLPMADRRASQRAHKLHQGTGLKPLAVEIGAGTDSVVIMNNDGSGETIVYDQGGWFYSVHMGHDGKHGVAAAEDLNGDIQVYYADLTDKNNPILTQLTSEPLDHYSAQLSWDNKKVVYTKFVTEAGHDEVVTMSTSGGTETILSTTFDAHLPAFAPNGKIMLMNYDTETIYIMNADGTGISQLITPGATQYDACPSVSPDGKIITFERYDSATDTDDVWKANIDGSNATKLTTNGQSWDPMFINNKIVYVSWDEVDNDIYSMDPNGQNQKPLTTNSVNEYFDYWWW